MAIPLNPGPDDETVTVSRVVLDREHFDALKAMADEEERTMSQQLRFVVKNWLRTAAN